MKDESTDKKQLANLQKAYTKYKGLLKKSMFRKKPSADKVISAKKRFFDLLLQCQTSSQKASTLNQVPTPLLNDMTPELMVEFQKYATSVYAENYKNSPLCSIIETAAKNKAGDDISTSLDDAYDLSLSKYFSKFNGETGTIDKNCVERKALLKKLTYQQQQLVFAWEHAREDNAMGNSSVLNDSKSKNIFTMGDETTNEIVKTTTGIPKHEAVAFINDLYDSGKRKIMSNEDRKLGANILRQCIKPGVLENIKFTDAAFLEKAIQNTNVKDISEQVANVSFTTNAHDWGQVSSNYRKNTTLLNNGNLKVPLPTTVNRGSAGMVHEHKGAFSSFNLGVLVPIRYSHGSSPLAKYDPLVKGGYERAKKIIKADLIELINKEAPKVGGIAKVNLANIKYFEHRYLGGLANDNEPISEMAVHMALEDAKKELKKDPKYKQCTGKFENVIYNNTCLTTGKDILGTSVSSEIPTRVQKLLNTPDSVNENNFGSEWIKNESDRLLNDPDFKEEFAEANNNNKDQAALSRAAFARAQDSANQIKMAIQGLRGVKPSSSAHHTDYKSSQAAYVNIIMSNLGFNIVTGCKSSVDRAGGEYTTRTTFSKFMRKYNFAPTSTNLENNPNKKADLAEMYLETYHELTAEVGAVNRGVKGTKTFMNFVAPEVKQIMKERSDALREKLGDSYITKRNDMLVKTDKELIELVKNGDPDERVLAQDAMVLNYQARDKLTIENSSKGCVEFDPSSLGSAYDQSLSKLREEPDLYKESKMGNRLFRFGSLPIVRTIPRVFFSGVSVVAALGKLIVDAIQLKKENILPNLLSVGASIVGLFAIVKDETFDIIKSCGGNFVVNNLMYAYRSSISVASPKQNANEGTAAYTKVPQTIHRATEYGNSESNQYIKELEQNRNSNQLDPNSVADVEVLGLGDETIKKITARSSEIQRGSQPGDDDPRQSIRHSRSQ